MIRPNDLVIVNDKPVIFVRKAKRWKTDDAFYYLPHPALTIPVLRESGFSELKLYNPLNF